MTIYSFKATNIRGHEVDLADYRGKVLLIVNTASKCGHTPQYAGLQSLYETYKDQEFAVLGFPCNQFGGQEPDTNDRVEAFCTLNYGVSFPMFAKIEVNGANQHPLFAYLTAQTENTGEIQWNFTKFLVNREGEVVKRFESSVQPDEVAPDIETLL